MFLHRKGFLYKAGRTRVAPKSYAPAYLAMDDTRWEDWPVMRKNSKSAAANECVEKLQKLAAGFFRIEDISRETLDHLKATAAELSEQIEKCRELTGRLETEKGAAIKHGSDLHLNL